MHIMHRSWYYWYIYETSTSDNGYSQRLSLYTLISSYRDIESTCILRLNVFIL